jgi:hypothetical protein
MNKKLLYSLVVSMAAFSPFGLVADDPTPKAEASQLQTQIRLNVKDDTEEVHLINTNNDPDVYTKVYVLKHADPYELRPYIKSAVQSKRVNSNVTAVECIKYNDGTSMMIVSAEDFRFVKQPNSMSIDEIVEIIDQPKVTSSSGSATYIYFPKYWDANSLRTVIHNVGTQNKNDSYELQGGKDLATSDPALNAIVFFTPKFRKKKIEEMLKLYDTPTSEVLVDYTIYEMDYENDGNIGTDFQAWKNGPGTDLLSVGSRYTNGWDIPNMSVNTRPYVNNSHTRYFNFNPKWNTKYLDFLVAKSKAKVLTSGALSIMNSTEGHIENTTQLASIKDGTQISNRANLNEYIRLTDVGWDDGTGAVVGNNGNYRINGAIDKNGADITLTRLDGTAVNANIDFAITRSTVGNETYYTMSVDHAADAWFFANGRNCGKEVQAFDATLQRVVRTMTDGAGPTYTYAWTDQTGWQTDRTYAIQRDVTRITSNDEYGFALTMTPIVCENATTIDITMTNTNLIGFQDNGSPRTSRTELSTKVMVKNSGEKFVIGGLEKKAVIRSVNKVPWLGSIPLIGWAVSGESEVTKRSQIVAVLECTPVTPDTKVPVEIQKIINETTDTLDNSGIKAGIIEENDYGYDQFLFDSKKTSLDPLP